MKDQNVAAFAALGSAVDWSNPDLDTQSIIEAGNQGRLGGPLTTWLIAKGWNLGRFVVKDHFKVNTGRKAKVKVSGLGVNFRNWLLNTTEELPSPVGLTSLILEQASLDSEIILKIGGVAQSIASLGEMWKEMEKQPDGPKSPAGKLLTNGYANIIYVPQPVKKINDQLFNYVGLDGKEVEEELTDPQYIFEIAGQWYVLRAVRVFWLEVGWGVYADSVEVSDRWSDGAQVFSRKSFDTLVKEQLVTQAP